MCVAGEGCMHVTDRACVIVAGRWLGGFLLAGAVCMRHRCSLRLGFQGCVCWAGQVNLISRDY